MPGAEESILFIGPLSAMCLLHVLPKIACLKRMHTGIGRICLKFHHIAHLVDWLWWHTAWIGGGPLRFVGDFLQER